MSVDPSSVERIRQAVSPERLVRMAVRLCEVYSPTLEAGGAADCLEQILLEEGVAVERPEADWPASPAVVARLDSGRAGRTLQFDGHLDTVHLPFVPPRVLGEELTGTGAADMKGGVAAAVEALLALRDSGVLANGAVLLTAHDHHEGPWGDNRQLHALIDQGFHGDGALVPEYLCDRLPLVGRGQAILRIRVSRQGEPVHEVYRPADCPDVIGAAAELVRRLRGLDASLQMRESESELLRLAGHSSVFIGQIHAGEIYNQSPVECRLEGTLRWVPGESREAVEAEYRALLAEVAGETGTAVEGEFLLSRDAFQVDPGDPLLTAFGTAYRSLTGADLPPGAKPFVDDGNTFAARAGIPAITHGPRGSGAHTLNERVSIPELARVARTYALTAIEYLRA